MTKPLMTETKCIFCGKESADYVLFPELLNDDTFSNYSFSARRKRKREHYKILKCKKCGLVRSSPIADEETINQLYKGSEFIFPAEAPFAAETYSLLLEKLNNKYKANSNSLLEIGCSTGFFLEKVKKIGMTNILGFEPSKSCFEHCTTDIKKNVICDIYKPELLNEKTFDTICSFHVWDHLTHPDETLKSLVEKLNTNGCVLFVCHDVEALSAKILKDHSPIFDIEHIYLFSQKTIRNLFKSAGLKILETGSLRNNYPIRYWLKMLPIFNSLEAALPSFISSIPLALKAGNLYAFGRKEA